MASLLEIDVASESSSEVPVVDPARLRRTATATSMLGLSTRMGVSLRGINMATVKDVQKELDGENTHYDEVDDVLRKLEEDGEDNRTLRRHKSDRSLDASMTSMVSIAKSTKSTKSWRRSRGAVVSPQGTHVTTDSEYREMDESELPKTLEDAIDVIKERDFEFFTVSQNMLYATAMGRELIEKLHVRNNENAALVEMCSTLENEKEAAEAQAAGLEREKLSIMAELSTFHQKVRSLETTLAYVQEEGQEYISKAASLEKQLVEKSQEIKSRTHDKDLAWATEKVTIAARLKEKDGEVESLQEKLEASETQRTEQVEALELKVAELTTLWKDEESNAAKLATELAIEKQARKEAAHKYAKQLEIETSQLRADLESKDSIVKTLRDAYAAMDEKKKASFEQVQSTEGEVQALRAQLEDAAAAHQNELHKGNHQIKQLQADLEAMGIRLQKEKDEKKVEVTLAQQQTAEKEAIIEQLHKAQSQAARDHEKLVAELAAAMAGKDSEMQQLRSRVERESGRRLEAKLADAERLHAELQKKYESLAGKLKEAQQAEVRLVEELDLKSSAATELQVQISRDAEELNKLKEECRVHQDSRARDQDVHDAAARQLKAEAAKLEAQVAALQGEAGALKTSVHRQRAGAEESKHELTARIGALAEAVHDGEKQLARQAADAEAKLLILQRTIDDKAAVIAKQDGARQQLENALHKSEQAEKKARSELSESQAELRKCRSTLETTTAALGRAEEQAKAAAAGGHHGKERDSLQAQLDDVKRALADEVKRHADTEAQHAAASKHWKTAADESRKAADARIDSIKRDYQSKLDSLHAKLVDTRHDAASQAQKHSKAKQEIETLRAERRTWEQDVQRKLEQLKNDEISHVEAHLAAHTQGEVSRHVLEHDLLKRDYQEEQQKVAQAKERLRDAEAAHRDDIARLRVEFDDQLRRELEEQAKLRQAIELQLSQQVAKTQAEAERCSVVEGKWRKASEDLKKREDELMRQVAHVTESIEGQVSWTAGQIEAEKAEHAKLEEQLEKAKGDLRTALAKAEARERDRMEEVRAAEAKARGVSSELAASQAACEAVGAQLAEVKGLLETAAQRNASTEDAAARRTEELTRQLHASREREVKLELQTEQLTKQLQDAVLQAERTKGAMAAQADELTEARAEEREATRRVRLAEGNALKAADENRDLRAQLADAGSLLGHAQSELETVHRRYARVADDARKQDEEQDHKARMLEHSVRREGLAGQLSRDDAALAEKRHSDLHKALRAKEKECASLQEELSSARRDADTADQALRHQLRLTHAKLAHQQAAASDLETALASAEASEKALHSDLDSHVQLLEQLRSELEAARDARLKAETRSQAMACKAAELEVKLKTTEQEHVAKLRKMREDSKNELYEHQKRAADASEHAATLQGTLKLTRESLDKTISSQRGDKSRTVEDVELLRRQVFELKSDNEEKEAALEVERTKCQQAEAEKQALRRSAEGLSETVTRLRLDLRSAETHLAAANSQQGQSEADRASKEDNRQKELHEARLRVEAETLRALAAETAVSHSREHADDMKAEIASLKLRLQDHWRCEEVLASARSLADRDRETARSEIESLKARQQAAVRGLEEARHDAAQWQEKASQLSLSEAQLSRSVRAAEERCAKLRKDAIPAAAELERLGLQKLALTDALNAADRREADLRSQLRQAGGHAALDMVPALRAERAERAETQQHALTQASAARDNIGRMRSEVLARETLLHAQRTPMPHR